MEKQDLLVLVCKIMENEYPSEEELNRDIAVLEQNTVDPDATDYIYYDDLSPEEVVEKILSYKPIQL